MKLSDHFTLEELTVSDTAARHGIDNTPTFQDLERLKRLAMALESVRKLLGHPIRISSGFRCQKLNKLIGSKPTSKHTQGLAADFSCPGFGTPLDIVQAIKYSDIDFDQCILEYYNPDNGNGWVHFGLAANNRRQVLTINKHGVFAGVHV
jgi:hypothetical protein